MKSGFPVWAVGINMNISNHKLFTTHESELFNILSKEIRFSQHPLYSHYYTYTHKHIETPTPKPTRWYI